MTLRARVSRLDEYSGELGQALEKLEIEHSRNALNRDEQMDFLVDLRRAMVAKDLLPLRTRSRTTLLLALMAGSGAVFLPSHLPNATVFRFGALGLALLCLALSLWSFIRLARMRRRDEAWLGRLEAAAARGGTIFDVPEEGR